jgi:hypothetical protein
MDFFIHLLLNEEKALIVNLGSTQFRSIIPQGLPLAFKWTMVIEPTQLTGISPPALFRLMILESAMFRTLLGVMMFVRVYLPVCRLLLLLPLMLNMLPLILAWIPLLTLFILSSAALSQLEAALDSLPFACSCITSPSSTSPLCVS